MTYHIRYEFLFCTHSMGGIFLLADEQAWPGVPSSVSWVVPINLTIYVTFFKPYFLKYIYVKSKLFTESENQFTSRRIREPQIMYMYAHACTHAHTYLLNVSLRHSQNCTWHIEVVETYL